MLGGTQVLLVRRLAPASLVCCGVLRAMHEADVLPCRPVRGPPLPGLLGIFARFSCSGLACSCVFLAFCALREYSVLLLRTLRGACACSAVTLYM
jgi:hypothetical protein